jgi:hypothetical protein
MARLTATGSLISIAFLSSVFAQEESPAVDLTLPPRIDPTTAAPGQTRLEPAPDEREDMLEAVVTGGQTDFRLPDLGTSFRADDEEYDPTERIDVQFLYLFDPENQDPAEEAFPSLEERLGVGMIKLFRITIGNSDKD